jgi:hypothetical protein
MVAAVSSRAEQAFHSDMLSGIERLKREIGYTPTRFIQMVGEYGGVEAVHPILRGRDSSEGFTTLWEHRRLEMSCEAYVLLPWYANLFSEKERAVARHRLDDHRFDVDTFVERASQNTPAWWTDSQQ